MKINEQEVSASDAGYRWVDNRFSMRSGFYAGRPPSTTDLNSTILEMFYKGIKKDVGDEAAANFVRFVNKLKDLSASSFIVAFDRFWASECKTVDISQGANDRMTLSGHGRALEGETIGLIGSMLGGGGNWSRDELESASWQIKSPFVRAHLSELPPDDREGWGGVIERKERSRYW